MIINDENISDNNNDKNVFDNDNNENLFIVFYLLNI